MGTSNGVNNTTCICLLEDGSKVKYDRMASYPNAYESQKANLEYLGKGTIYSIDGKVQNYDLNKKNHFWKEKW